MKWASRLLPLAASLLAACGGEGAPSGIEGGASSPCAKSFAEARQAIVDGQIDALDPAVVAVNTLSVECQRAGAPACTGTLVRPDRVLTAAHCVGEMPAASFAVLFGPKADLGQGPPGEGLLGSFFLVSAIFVHPGFDPATLANDVALLELAGAPAVAPMGVASAQGGADLVAGAAARVVGYGLSEVGATFEKRSGDVVLKEVSPQELVFGRGPSLTCSGDSGGPLLVEMDGAPLVVGVTSRGDAKCDDHGVATRVDVLQEGFFDAPF